MAAPKGNTFAKKEINWKLIDNLLEINATGEEIASVLDIDYDTIQNHCKKEKGLKFSEYIKKGNHNFKVSLKRLQLRSAKGVFTKDKNDDPKVIIAPSVTMQIWLGKQYLGQRDRQTIEMESVPNIIFENVSQKK